MNFYKTKSGLTLLEILTVVAILGVLVILSVPRYFSAIERFRAEEGRQILLALLTAQKHFFLENRAYATSMAQLDVSFSVVSDNYETVIDSDISVASPLVAQVRRRGGLYTLRINAQGVISCAGSTNLCPMLESHLNN